jgi:hypothetical protein
MRNSKGIIGLVVLVAVFVAVVISTTGMTQNVSQEDRLKAIDIYITSAEKRIVDLESQIKALETRVQTIEKSKAIASPVSKAVVKSAIVPAIIAGKNQVFHATPGQTVFLNSQGTKFHFWDGCAWFGYGNETTLETALEGGAVECLLCQGHKVIKK